MSPLIESESGGLKVARWEAKMAVDEFAFDCGGDAKFELL